MKALLDRVSTVSLNAGDGLIESKFSGDETDADVARYCESVYQIYLRQLPVLVAGAKTPTIEKLIASIESIRQAHAVRTPEMQAALTRFGDAEEDDSESITDEPHMSRKTLDRVSRELETARPQAPPRSAARLNTITPSASPPPLPPRSDQRLGKLSRIANLTGLFTPSSSASASSSPASSSSDLSGATRFNRTPLPSSAPLARGAYQSIVCVESDKPRPISKDLPPPPIRSDSPASSPPRPISKDSSVAFGRVTSMPPRLSTRLSDTTTFTIGLADHDADSEIEDAEQLPQNVDLRPLRRTADFDAYAFAVDSGIDEQLPESRIPERQSSGTKSPSSPASAPGSPLRSG
eukprot:jgi/Hompol1/3035/HPOL_005621-RA